MALPPEPLSELLSQAQLIVEAEVTALQGAAPTPAEEVAPLGTSGLDLTAPEQRVELRVDDVLQSSTAPTAPAPAAVITATKPEAAYRLEIGTRGAYFLQRRQDSWCILGRYGPDTYSLAAVRQRIAPPRGA